MGVELTGELTRLEKGFWTEGVDYYRDHLADECRMVFPEMGALSRTEAMQGLQDGPRWQGVKMTDLRTERPSDGTAVLTYRAQASRGDQPAYRAFVGSVYVRQDDGWVLAFHQHTPEE